MPSQLWHTFRHPSGSRQNTFGLIEGQSSGGPVSGFIDVGCGSADGQALQVVGVGYDGKLWHTIRDASGHWQTSFGLIESQSSGGPANFKRIACIGAGQALHVVGVGVDNKLWHTFRDVSGHWQAFLGQVPGAPLVGFADVGCGSAGGQLPQVVGVGIDGKLWHTVRTSSVSWQASFGLIESQSFGGPPVFNCVAGVGVGQDMHVVGLGADDNLWHTFRHPSGSWQTFFGLIESQSSGGSVFGFSDVACGSADGQALQVVGVGADYKLWHTIRDTSGHWQTSFGLIESQSSGGPAGFERTACAGAGQDLHVVGLG